MWADLHNIGTVLRNQPLPKGRRVAGGFARRVRRSGDGRGRLRRAAGGLGGHVPHEPDGLLSRDDQEVQGDLPALLRVLEPDGPHGLR